MLADARCRGTAKHFADEILQETQGDSDTPCVSFCSSRQILTRHEICTVCPAVLWSDHGRRMEHSRMIVNLTDCGKFGIRQLLASCRLAWRGC